MGRVFVNRTLIVFQIIALFLFIMFFVYLLAIWNRVLWQQCAISACVGPVYFLVLMMYVGGTFLAPVKVEIFQNSVMFSHFLKARSKSFPFNRIKEIELPAGSRSNRIVIVDNHGEEHKFYMVSHRISKVIVDEYKSYLKNKDDDDRDG
jgi:hypothetical protein